MSHLYDRLIDCGPTSDNIMVRLPVNTRPWRSSSLRNQLGAPIPRVFTARPRSPATSLLLQCHPTSSAWNIPPIQPLPWVWVCHRCRQRYPLGTTRRCLEDGHLFCTGRTSLTTGKRIHEGEIHGGYQGGRRKKRQERSCSSSFDYSGWTEWQAWRRETLEKEESREVGERDCWLNCDFPSECRWNPRFQEQNQNTPEEVGMPAITTTHETEQEEDEDTMMSDVGTEPYLDVDIDTPMEMNPTLETIAEELEPELVTSIDEPGSPEEEFVDADDDDDIMDEAMVEEDAVEEEEVEEELATVTETATAVFIPSKHPLRTFITSSDVASDDEMVHINPQRANGADVSTIESEGTEQHIPIPSPISPLKQHYLLPGNLPGIPQ